jgi:hypothetical protein
MQGGARARNVRHENEFVPTGCVVVPVVGERDGDGQGGMDGVGARN